MYATTEQARQAALQRLLSEQARQGRTVSIWVQRAMLRTLPAKEINLR